MSGLAGSDVLITKNGEDISNHCTIAGAEFNVSASAQPGEARLVLRDPDRELSFTSGDRIRAWIDGVPMWSGYALVPGRGSFFPAGDGREETRARRFNVRCIDRNILFDRRIFYNKANPLAAPPDIVANTMDGALIRQALVSYGDWADDGLDLSSEIDDVRVPAANTLNETNPWGWIEGGSAFRQLFADLSLWSGAVYYIGPDEKIHYHAFQSVENAWGFSDEPNAEPITGSGGFEGRYIGFRELEADEDGSQLATDAFVWGGGAPVTETTVFARATDPALEAVHGKWQLAETHFNEKNFKTQENVTIRANMVVFGNAAGTPGGAQPGSVAGEGPRGLRFSQWSYGFTWFSKDVPVVGGVPLHLRPGAIVPIQLNAFGLTKFLPLRAMRITFPSGAKNGKAHVQFSGLFDLRNDDPFTLWKYLRNRDRKVSGATAVRSVTDGSTTAGLGDRGQFTPTPLPNGSQTVFTIPFGYIPLTTQVFINGLIQRRGIDYLESDPEGGQITFTSAPVTGDKLYVICRTLG